MVIVTVVSGLGGVAAGFQPHPSSSPSPSAPVAFNETGLPSSTVASRGWTVWFNGSEHHVTSASTGFSLANGGYPYLIAGPRGYQVASTHVAYAGQSGPHAGQGIAQLSLGRDPAGMAYDPVQGLVFVGYTALNETTTGISDAVNGVLQGPSAGRGPTAMAYDSGHGLLFVANLNDSNVTVANVNITPTSSSHFPIVASVAVGGTPEDIAYDSGRGELFVADGSGDNLSVINDTTYSVVATVSTGPVDPFGVAYDPNRSEVFVANRGADSVAVYSDTNNSRVSVIPVGTEPVRLAYDGKLGEVFVTNYGSDNVSVISAASNKVLASVPVGPNPLGVAYDSGVGEVFVADHGSAAVSILSDASDTEMMRVPVGPEPWGVTYDSGKGEILVSNSLAANVSVLADSGIGLFANRSSGTVLVSSPPTGAYLHVGVSFVRGPTYTLRFHERGLPAVGSGYQVWCIALDEISQCTNKSTMLFANLTPAEYSYGVRSPLLGQSITLRDGRTPVPLDGSILVTTPQTVVVTFAYPYLVAFHESGLTTGMWSVSIKGHTETALWNGTIDFNLTNHTYLYRIGSVTGFQSSGVPPSLTVNGAAQSVAVTFTKRS